MRLKLALVTILAIFAPASSAWAQGCALCYTTASAAGAAAERSLNWGILALLAPALIMFLSVLFLLFRRAASTSA
jgi:hypothetical protein